MTENEQTPYESLVVADFGRGVSRAYLLEQVAGAFRFIAKAEAPTTAELPFEDLAIGWSQLLRQLEWSVGRSLTVRDDLIMPQIANGDGVDGLLVCTSLPEPVRVAILEAGSSPITVPLLEAAKRAHARLFHVVAPAGRKDGGWAAAQVEALRAFRPEMVILIAGSNHADAMPRLIQLIKQLSLVGSVARAVVIADGQAQEHGLTAFGSAIRARGVSPATRQPADIVADLERELLDAFRARASTPDFKNIVAEATGDILSRTHAVDLVNRFIARVFGRRVVTIGIDDGTHVHYANPDDGTLATVPNLDVMAGITGLTEREVLEAASWLPFDIQPDELIAWVLNRSIRPWTLPDHPRDLAIEQALARQVARRALSEITRTHPVALSSCDLVIGGPVFARWNQPGAAALALLDCLDVVPNDGVIDLALDQDGLMAVAGILGTVDPALASHIFEYDTLTHLGSAVVIGGTTHEGDLACRGEIHYENGDMGQFSVASGSVEVLPLRPGETATLVLRPERRYAIGGNAAGKTVTLADERRIVGGLVGVIIDARSRTLLTTGIQRPQKLKQWLDAVNGIKPPAVRRLS